MPYTDIRPENGITAGVFLFWLFVKCWGMICLNHAKTLGLEPIFMIDSPIPVFGHDK